MNRDGNRRLFAALILLALSACVPPIKQSLPGGQPAPYDFLLQSVFYILCGCFVYFLLVTKPKADQEAKQQKFITALKKGDEVVTSGGLYGRIAQTKPDAVTLEIAPNVRVRVRPADVFPVPAPPDKRPGVVENASANGKK